MFSLLFCLFVQWCFFYRSFVAVEEAKGDDDEIVIKFRLLFHRFDLMWSFVVVNTVIVCPEEADYAPCNCIEDDLKPDTILLNCSDLKLTDSQVGDILDTFLITPGVSPLQTDFGFEIQPIDSCPIEYNL